MASEEQKADLKFKLTVGTIFAVVIAIAYALGPGLAKILDYWRRKKTDPKAPQAYYIIGRIYGATFRPAEAKAVWEEFYVNWSGDEATNEFITDALTHVRTNLDPNDWSRHYFLPMVNNTFGEGNPRPHWIGGDNAPPHPLLQKVLIQYGHIYEDGRDWASVQHIYALAYYAFPRETDESKWLETAQMRMVQRGFGW